MSTPAGRTVAVTFDDLPVISVVHGDVESHGRITDQLLGALATHGIPATGFVIASAVERGDGIEEERVDLLRRWRDAGHELANHTFGHLDLNAVPVEAFEADIVRGEPLVRLLLAARGQSLRWFRHPYLHTGTSLATKRRIESLLADRGQRVAPVSVHVEDWLFAAALDRARARGDQRLAEEVSRSYVPHFEKQFEHAERLSRRLVGHEVPQILLLHANTINAERMGELAVMLRRRGYEFVPLERALADPIYAEPDDDLGGETLGVLERLASQRGHGVWADGQPRTPRVVRVNAEPTQLEQMRITFKRHSRTARRTAKAVLRAVGVLPPKRTRPAA